MARGDGSIYQRGRIYWISYMAPGPEGDSIQIRESSKSENEKIARNLLKDRLRKVANARAGEGRFIAPRKEKATVGDLLDALLRDYTSREIKGLYRAENLIKAVKAIFGHVRAVALTTDRVRAFIVERQEASAKPATINRQVEVLAQAFRLAVKEDRLASSPYFPRLAERNARQGFLEREEMDALLSKMEDETLADLVRFAYASGWRMGEIRGLRWEWIDQNSREVRLPDSKSGRPRVLPLAGPDWEIIERALARRQYATGTGPAISEFVFHKQGVPIPETTLRHSWNVARDAAELPRYLFHDLRRTVARDLVHAGVPEVVAMKVTGHETNSMFKRYAGITTTEDTTAALSARRQYLEARTGKRNVVKGDFAQTPAQERGKR